MIVAAGSSRRMAGEDKMWAPLSGRPVVLHSLERLTPHVDQSVVVVKAGDIARVQELIAGLRNVSVVAGGSERQESVRAGLRALGSVDAIAVHDAARPFAAPSLLSGGAVLLAEVDGAVPALPVTDTVKAVRGDVIEQTLDREQLRVAQTPQIFRAAALRDAHGQAQARGFRGTDDASLLEKCNYRVVAFPGDPMNFKITTSTDLALARCVAETKSR